MLFFLLAGGEARAESYTVQTGIYKNLKNAQLQYNSIYNALPEPQRIRLRIEKSGNLYAVRIGKFETQAQAEALLPALKPFSAQAFIRKDDPRPEDILITATGPAATLPPPAPKANPPDPGTPKTDEKSSWKVVKPIPPEEVRPPSGPAPQEQPPFMKGTDRPPPITPAPQETGLKRKTEKPISQEARKKPALESGKIIDKGIEPSVREMASPPATGLGKAPASTPPADAAIPANRAWLRGSIREFSPLPPAQLGLKPGKEIFRLIVQVEDTEAVAGYANLLTEKGGDLLTVFSENNHPFFKIGNRIKALIEYRGNRYSRFFWIIKTEAPAQ